MAIPYDTSRRQMLALTEAQPLRQWEEGKPRSSQAPKTNEDGEILWGVQVAAFGEGDAEVILVEVPGDPKVKQGELVQAERLTAHPWEVDKKHGIKLRAVAVRPVNARAQAEKAAA